MFHNCNSSLLCYQGMLLGSRIEATHGAVTELQVTFTAEQKLYLSRKQKKKAKCKRLTAMRFNGIANLISKQRVCKRCAAGHTKRTQERTCSQAVLLPPPRRGCSLSLKPFPTAVSADLLSRFSPRNSFFLS